MIINLTGITVKIFDEVDGALLATFNPDNRIARVELKSSRGDPICGIPVKYGHSEVMDLPLEEKDTYYIVDQYVKLARQERQDLLTIENGAYILGEDWIECHFLVQ